MTPLQWKRLIYRVVAWVIVLALFGIATGIGLTTWRIYSRGEEARVAHENAAASVKALEARKIALETSLEKLQTDRGVEEEVRKRFQVAKPGEEVIVLVGADTGALSTESELKDDFWASLVKWFKH